MIDLYFWPTPNGYKPLICLEELGLEYRIQPVNIMRGDQFKPEFLAIAPNNRMPAMVDDAPSDGGEPYALFESGSILIYLAEKTGRFLASNERDRHQTLQWLMWQMGGVGPMMGQANHFVHYAPEDIPYGKKRYTDETKRLLGVLETQLNRCEFIAGAYSIADMACYPWIKGVESLGIPLSDFPRVADWITRISERSAVQQAYTVGEAVRESQQMDDEARQFLFSNQARPQS